MWKQFQGVSTVLVSSPRAKRGDWVMKMAILAEIVSRQRKAYGGAAAGGMGGGQGERGAEGLDR